LRADRSKVEKVLGRLRFRRGHDSDEGFGLIEVVVAMVVAALVLMAVAAGLIAGVKATALSRINQQAGDLLDATIEKARAQGYDALAMSTTDGTLAGDTRLSTGGCPNSGAYCISLPNLSGSGTHLESLVMTASGGYVSQHTTTVTASQNKVPFTVSTYVTSPPDEAGAKYKRVTVFVAWRSYGANHTREASTMVTNTRRGLPLPHFKLTAVTATNVTVNPGAQVYFGFKLTNLGAPDAWDFVASDETLGWSYYVDNGDGQFDPSNPGVETAMTDTDGNGTRDTGVVGSNNYVIIWVFRTIPLAAAPGTTSSVTFTATSAAEPFLGPGVSSLTQKTSVTISSGVITPSPSPTPSGSPTPTPTPTTSCTPIGPTPTTGSLFYLHNTVTGVGYNGTGSTAVSPDTFSTNSPTATSLVDYSTDDGYPVTPGRVVKALGSTGAAAITLTNALQVTDFQYRLSVAHTYGGPGGTPGTGYLTIWAEPQSGLASDPVNLRVYFGDRTKSGSSYVLNQLSVVDSTNATWGCAGWNKITIAFTVPSTTLKNNDYLDVIVENTGSKDVRLGYDTTANNAAVVLPVAA
jgi:prepilin-type N-terminal cleavage/methylation domain-containing protein